MATMPKDERTPVSGNFAVRYQGQGRAPCSVSVQVNAPCPLATTTLPVAVRSPRTRPLPRRDARAEGSTSGSIDLRKGGASALAHLNTKDVDGDLSARSPASAAHSAGRAVSPWKFMDTTCIHSALCRHTKCARHVRDVPGWLPAHMGIADGPLWAACSQLGFWAHVGRGRGSW